MIKNRRELEAAASQWMGFAMNDLRNQLISFIEEHGTNEEELADALTVPVEEIDTILNGDGEIALSTFAKLLIGTDNVIEIKPAALMKQQGFRPPRGRMQMPPMGENRFQRRPMGENRFQRRPNDNPTQMPPMDEEFPIPPMGEGFPMPPMGEDVENRFGGMPGMKKKMKNMPNRLPNGRFAPKNKPQCGTMQRVRLDDIDLDELGRNELCNIIRQNHWDSEINLQEVKRGELIDFLTYKMTQPELHQRPQRREVPITEVERNTNNEMTENERIGRMLAEEVARNPHLKEMVKKYL